MKAYFDESKPMDVATYQEIMSALMDDELGIRGDMAIMARAIRLFKTAVTVGDTIRKAMENQQGLNQTQLSDELGEVLFEGAALCQMLSLDLSRVMVKSIRNHRKEGTWVSTGKWICGCDDAVGNGCSWAVGYCPECDTYRPPRRRGI